MKRYLADVVPTKRPTSQVTDQKRSKILVKHLGKYSLTSLTPEVIANFEICDWQGKTARMLTASRGQERMILFVLILRFSVTC